MSILDAFFSLGKDTNKSKGKNSDENKEGIISEKLPELTLEMTDEQLSGLTKKWEKSWNESSVKGDWIRDSEEQENYWLGKQFARTKADKSRAIVDNVIFEALETYLPQVTRRNPEGMVEVSKSSQETPEATNYAKAIQKGLGELADELKLRLKLKKAARHWAIYLLGAVKYGWDATKDIPSVKVVRVAKLILDPDATIDEDGYTGDYIGEYRKKKASSLLEIIDEDKKQIITEHVKNDLGTYVQFIEWWTDEYMCWTLGDKVLLKRKNPHWNYGSQQPAQADATGLTPATADGQPAMQEMPGLNHFPASKKPFTFLSVFNLGKKPIDDTSLIGQNLSNQDRVNKRINQIDKNADSMNGGIVVSLERSGLNKDQASDVTNALRKGGTIAIPTGSPREAIDRFTGEGLPPDIYNDLVDVRNRTRDIFGTRGSSPAGVENEDTVRGKIINRGLDTDRIGGGVSEYLEQMADEIYNWLVQLLYVYDEAFQSLQFTPPKLNISVKEGSLLPKDSTTIANQAIELSGAGKMSTIDLYKRLDYPNPEELAANVWLEVNAPQILYKDNPLVQEAIAAMQNNSGAKPPSTSISYKDLPPDGQAQLASQAGITLHPEAVAVFNDHEKAKEQERSKLSKAQEQVNKPPTN